MTSGRLLLCLTLLCAALAEVRAAPLDADACAKLATEHGELEVAGIDKEMAKGPEWGKANLGPEKLAQVRRFIELEELMLFRCRGKSLVTIQPDPEPFATGDPDKQEADDKQDNQGKEPPAAKPAPAAAPGKGQAVAPKQKTEAANEAEKTGAGKKAEPAAQSKSTAKSTAKPTAKPKPAPQPKKQDTEAARKAPTHTAAPRPPVSDVAKSPPKAKVDDAYKAPPPDPSVNPFAGQLKLPAR
jgi:hypothetical protein